MSNFCKDCSDRQYLHDLFTPHNNPKEYKPKYGRDWGETITLGGVRKLLVKAARAGATHSELCDLIDKEFLFGCWGHELTHQIPELLRDLRGIIIELLPGRKARNDRG